MITASRVSSIVVKQWHWESRQQTHRTDHQNAKSRKSRAYTPHDEPPLLLVTQQEACNRADTNRPKKWENLKTLAERKNWRLKDHERERRLTTQAQRPGPRDAWIATTARWPGSLQRMVRRTAHSPSLVFQIRTFVNWLFASNSQKAVTDVCKGKPW